MIADRSDTPTGKCCVLCAHEVTRPWAARPDEYLVCHVCAGRRQRVHKPTEDDVPDLSDSFWRTATGNKS